MKMERVGKISQRCEFKNYWSEMFSGFWVIERWSRFHEQNSHSAISQKGEGFVKWNHGTNPVSYSINVSAWNNLTLSLKLDSLYSPSRIFIILLFIFLLFKFTFIVLSTFPLGLLLLFSFSHWPFLPSLHHTIAYVHELCI